MRFSLFILIGWLLQAALLAQVEPQPENPIDPLLMKARQSAAAATENLPNFTSLEVTTRYRKDLSDGSWKQRDVLTANVAYDLKTGESYTNIKVDNAPASKEMLGLPGSNSIGEFALDLRNMFASVPNDDFHINEEVSLNGKATRVFTYEVDQAASHWKIKDRDHAITPAYAGRIWVDKTLGRVIRLEMIADGLAPALSVDQVTTTIDYGSVDLGDGRVHFLPIASETLFCIKETGACDRNTTEFRSYRQFTVDSALAFGQIPSEFGLSASGPAPAVATAKRGMLDAVPHALVGVVRAPQNKKMILELDDTRYIFFIARGNDRLGLNVGDRVRLVSNEFDGHALVADSFSVLQTASASTAPPPQPPPPISSLDPVVEKAREGAKTLVLQLPNFLCKEEVKRYRNWPKHEKWQFEDALSAEVIYSGRTGEEYRDIRVNGKPTNKPWLELSGDVSTGEFGSLLRGVLSTRSTEFKFERTDTVNGSPAREYSFLVNRAESDWTIMSDYQFITPAYSGRLWFDQDSNNVLRIARRAEQVPSAFPISSIETEVTFGMVHLGPSETYLLPLHAETRACIRENQECSRKTIDFREYKKFTGESKIIF